MDVEIKTKYASIRFSEDFSGTEEFFYTVVNFECLKESEPMARLFALTMDHFVRAEVRKRMAEELGLNPEKDIELEDAWLMVSGYSRDEKHLTVKIIAIVRAAEAEFDRMLNFLPINSV